METVFFFNCGVYAHKSGAERVAPDTAEYPIFGWGDDTHKVLRTETVRLSASEKMLWLQGYDKRAKSVADVGKPKAKLTWVRNYR